MNPDEKLNALLKMSRGIEPSPGFEDGVWRRIHAASAANVKGVSSFRDWLLPRPAWVTALAAAASIMIGMMAGFSAPHSPGSLHASGLLLRSQTLAGSYVAMSTGVIK